MVHLAVMKVIEVVTVNDLGVAAPAVMAMMMVRDRPVRPGAGSAEAAR